MWRNGLLRKIHQDKSACHLSNYARQIDPLMLVVTNSPHTIPIYIGSKMVYVFARPILFIHLETGFVTTVSINPHFCQFVLKSYLIFSKVEPGIISIITVID